VLLSGDRVALGTVGRTGVVRAGCRRYR
jgi:hypothetical protein